MSILTQVEGPDKADGRDQSHPYSRQPQVARS